MGLARLFLALILTATASSTYNIFAPRRPSCSSCGRHGEKRRIEVVGHLQAVLGPVNRSHHVVADYDTEQMITTASTFQYSSSPFERESFTLVGSPSSDDSFSFTLNPSTRNREVPEDGILALWITGPFFNLPVAVDVVDGEGRRVFHRYVELEASNGDQKLFVPINASDVARWLDIGGSVELSVSAMQGDLNLLVGAEDEEFARKKPILHIVTKRRAGRSKRSPDMNTCPNRKYPAAGVGCCLFDLIINFHELGWKHVIAPQKFNAFACAGTCKILATDQGTINRAGTTNNEHSCCHVDKTEPLDVVFVNHEKELITREVSGMIATHCACT